MSALHAQLVDVAGKWLRRECAVVITELATIGEEPDAIGWHGSRSILVECKATRADFRADLTKDFRSIPRHGIGLHRYYLSIPGVISLADLPSGWGLLEVTGSRVRKVVDSGEFEANTRHEISILLSTLRRIGSNPPIGVSIRCYTIPTKNRATLSVRESASLPHEGEQGSEERAGKANVETPNPLTTK